MSIRLIPRFKPSLNYKEVFAALSSARNSIATYEAEFASKFGCGHGIMFSYGRSALYALLKAWDIKDAEIICPAYTCVVVQHAIVLSGNIPVFVDCSAESFNMEYEGIEKAFNSKTRAVIPTHLFGYPMDVERIDELVSNAENKFGQKIYVVQDVAHSYGASWNGKPVTEYGDASIFGCNISKIITSVFGGMAITRNKETYQKLKDYRQQNFKRKPLKWMKRLAYLFATITVFNQIAYKWVNWMERKGFLDSFSKYFEEGKIDFPGDWDVWPSPLEARIGRVQLKKYDKIIENRVKNSQMVMAHFKEDQDVRFFPEIPGTTFSHCPAVVDDRDKWVEDYRKKGIQLGIVVEYSVPHLAAYKKYAGNVEFPFSKYYSEHVINFPIHKKI